MEPARVKTCGRNFALTSRNMKPAWEKTCGLKFQLTSRTIVQPNGGTREVPCYSLTKTECLYIATKFNDEARCDRGLMKAIRKMEPAWEKVNGGKFSLVEYRDKKGELRPCYSLTKTECLYIATKFNDEARAKLVLRWEELEMADVRCTLRHCCVTFFVKYLYKCKKRSTFVTVCCNVFTLLVYI